MLSKERASDPRRPASPLSASLIYAASIIVAIEYVSFDGKYTNKKKGKKYSRISRRIRDGYRSSVGLGASGQDISHAIMVRCFHLFFLASNESKSHCA